MPPKWCEMLVLGDNNQWVRSYNLDDHAQHTCQFKRQKWRALFRSGAFARPQKKEERPVPPPRRVILPSIPASGLLIPLDLPHAVEKRGRLFSEENTLSAYDWWELPHTKP
jgi:hypothetical protein